MKNKIYFLILLILCPVLPAQAAGLVSVSVRQQQEIITLDVRKNVPHKVFTVSDPYRLVVDVPSIPGRHEVALPSSYSGKLIKAMRFGQFDPGTSRFVFDLTGPVKITGTHEGEKSGQLVIEIAAAQENSRTQEETKPLFPGQPKPGKAILKMDSVVNEESTNTVESASDKTEWPSTADRKTASYKKETRHKAHKHAKSGKPLIVIDPGHGGVDPGTIGPDGTEEKDVVLGYARALKARLLKTSRYRVMLTREDDRFIMLRKRVDIARKAGADMFVSLHADSAPELSARGLSVYTVSEKASDKETAALAARENKSDVLAGIDLSDERNDVAGILISLAERDTMNRSATLADELVISLDGKVHLLPNTHRFAGFAVLKAPDIPSVLIEIGFLSHPKEVKMLKSKACRDKVVAGIASGVEAYFRQQRKAGVQ